MPPIVQEFEGPGKTLVAVEVIVLVTEQASAGSCELDSVGETAMQRHEDFTDEYLPQYDGGRDWSLSDRYIPLARRKFAEQHIRI